MSKKKILIKTISVISGFMLLMTMNAGLVRADEMDMPPLLLLLGDNPINLNVGDTYTDAGALAMDDVDGDIAYMVLTMGEVDTNTAGTYTMNYLVMDSGGNTATAERTINVNEVVSADTTAPLILILGDNPVELNIGDTYTDAGALAMDDVDGDLTFMIMTDTPVNTAAVGTYIVTYMVMDMAGNIATAERIVSVNAVAPVDMPPMLLLLGDNPIELFVGETYAEPGYAATDDVDGDLIGMVLAMGEVDASTAGIYTISYLVMDSSGNTATAERVVNVSEDTEAPVINIILPTDADVYYYKNADPNITVSGTATDNIGLISIGSSISGDGSGGGGGHGLPTPDPEINFNYEFTLYEGENIITISGADEAGNSASDIIIIHYSLPDTTAPLLLIQGDNPVNLNVGDTYVDAGALAMDDIDGDITAMVMAIGEVDTNTAGTYTISYLVMDSSGNTVTAERTINVNGVVPPPPPSLPTDTAAPVRTNGAPAGTLSAGTAQIDLTLNTDEAATCHYGTTAGATYEAMTGIISAATTTAHTLTINGLANDTNYKYYVRCADESGNANTDDYEISFYIDKAAAPAGNGGGGSSSGGSSSGGGGGGGASVSNSNPTSGVGGGIIDEIEEVPLVTTEDTGVQTGDEEKTENNTNGYQNYTSLIGADSPTVEMVSAYEAGQIHANTGFVELSDATRKIYEKIIAGAPELTDNTKYAIAYFIHLGTATTQKLGAGERAGALNSYIAAFGKYPVFAAEWQDVIKIANGRWPTERSESAEKRAKTSFEAIYKRPADMNQQNDNAAVTIMAYGLRPAQRNTESEKAAIKTFEHIFDGSPKSAIDWDIVRAIAYSGAIR